MEEDSNTSPTDLSRGFIPFRMVLDFKDEDRSDFHRVREEGLILHNRLVSYFEDKFERRVNVVFVKSIPGSLDHRSYLDFDMLDLLGDVFTEITAAQWLVGHLWEFLGEHYQDRLKGYAVSAGLIQRVLDEEALKEDVFPTNYMVASKERVIEPSVNQGELPTQAQTYQWTTLGRIMLACILIGLLAWNILQHREANRALKQILSLADGAPIQSNGSATNPITLNVEVASPSVADTQPVQEDDQNQVEIEDIGSTKIIRINP